MATPTSIVLTLRAASVTIENRSEARAQSKAVAEQILALAAELQKVPVIDVVSTRHGDDAPALAFALAVSQELDEHLRQPVRDAIAELHYACRRWGGERPATANTHPALPFMVDRLAESTPAELVVLLRRAQAERDRLVAENINLEAQLTRATNALHAAE